MDTQLNRWFIISSSSRLNCLLPSSFCLAKRAYLSSFMFIPVKSGAVTVNGSYLPPPFTISCHTSIPSLSQ